MANEKTKASGTGKAGSKSSRWAPRAVAKQAAKKQRRAEDRSGASYFERRHAERMQRPEFRRAFEKLQKELERAQRAKDEKTKEDKRGAKS